MDQFYYNSSGSSAMKLSKKGLAYIIGIEGMCATPYLDAVGVWTIGIGITSYDGVDVKNMPRDKPLSIQEMVDQFKDRVSKYEESVTKLVKQPISQQEFDAFVSFQYNTGGLGKSSALKLFNQDKDKKSVVAAMQLWNKAGGKVLAGLTRRRKEEGEIFLNGEYAGKGMTTLFTADKNGKQSYKNAKQIDIIPYL